MAQFRTLCVAALLGMFLGCASSDSAGQPSLERGPQGTVAYKILIESNEPGVRIEANKEYAGITPLELKIFGDKDGTFHNFGSDHYVIRAIPVTAGQHQHSKFFRTGGDFLGEDTIPRRIFFDMTQPENTFIEGGDAPRW